DSSKSVNDEIKNNRTELKNLRSQIKDLQYNSDTWRSQAKAYQGKIRELKMSSNLILAQAQNAFLEEKDRIAENFQKQIDELNQRQESYEARIDDLEAEAMDTTGDAMVKIQEALNEVQEKVDLFISEDDLE